MALRTVNPWLDHRHDARLSGYRRRAILSLIGTMDCFASLAMTEASGKRSPDERKRYPGSLRPALPHIAGAHAGPPYLRFDLSTSLRA
jgi:hypothetical protein